MSKKSRDTVEALIVLIRLIPGVIILAIFAGVIVSCAIYGYDFGRAIVTALVEAMS
ncbi:MAG: hypothetical protein OEY10_00190 [Nitrosopumilus sp.]|nr:hypothetical protein [Nitrosopumilus sp.]